MADDEQPTSVWKKEISFRRKPAAERGDGGEATSIWKKELSFRKKPQAAEPEPEPEVTAPAPVAAAIEPVAPAPVPVIEHDWLTQPLEQVSEPPVEPVPPVSLVPPVEPPAQPAPEPEPVEAQEQPTAVLPEPAPAVEPAAKVPFYKKELSFKRRREWDAAEPAAEPTPKARRLPRPKPALPSLPSFSRGGGSGKRVVGLKIGGSQIAAARIHNGERPELVQAVREPLEHGIVVGGELRDPEALALALKEFFARHKLPRRGIRLGIANNRIGVRTFEVTGIADPKQLANAIRFRAQEVLPIPVEEAVLDFQVLAEGVTEDGQPTRKVMLVVAYRELVDRYVHACRRAGLQLAGIDLEAFALLRAVAEPEQHVPGSERGALVAVSVGHERSTFAVSDGRVCEFTRVLEWGGWALNVAIARALDLSPSEVEPLKRALAFGGSEAVPAGFTQEQLATGREAARKQLQTFARELVSSLQFYQNQPGSLGIGEVALTGGTAHMAGLAAELERLIGVPVRVADPLGRLVVSKKVVERGQVGSLAIAIGLGIEDASYVPPVDLLPRDDVRKSFEANRGVAFGAAGGTALATAVLASMLMSAGGAVDGKRTELDSLRAQIAAIPVVTAEDTSDEDMLAAEKGARVGALSAALADRVAWDRVLRQVSLVLPEDVWLTNLSAAAPGGAAPVAGTATAASGFTLTGATYSQNGVARFLSRLSVVPDLRNVRLQSSQSAVVGERELVQFTILADVRAPGDAVVEAGS